MAGVIALIAGGALTEAGLFTVAAETAGALGAGQVVSNLVGGAVVGKAAQFIEQKVIEGAEAIGDAVLGSEKLTALEKSVGDFFADSQAAYSNDVDYFIKRSQGATFNYTKDEIKDREDLTYNDDIQSANIVPGLGLLPGTSSNENIDARELGRFVVDYSNNLAGQAFNGLDLDPTKALADTLSSTSNEKMADVVVPYLINKGYDTEEYSKISSIYNGISMSIEDNIQQYYDSDKELIYFILTDETGQSVRLDQTVGIIIPALYDTFLGARSQNNKLPTTITGLFCAFHDYSYIDGISRTGDMQLLSRLTQNYSRMTEQEKPFARIAMVYFSTLGSIASKLLGTDASGGIYDEIIPFDASSTEVSKDAFNAALQDSIDEHMVTEGITSTASSLGYTAFLFSDFGNIMVELN